MSIRPTRTTPRRRGLLACAAVGALAAPGLAAAQEVNVYNWAFYIGETTIADFEQETGIDATYDVFDSNEQLESLMVTGNSGYDVVVPTAQPFLARGIEGGFYQKLDRSKIPNWSEVDPALLKKLETADPGNQYALPYQWGTNGIGYNAGMIAERAPDAPTNSLRMLFDPELVSQFADCGVTYLDAPTDVMPMVLHYLGLDPNSEDPADYERVEEALLAVRPHLRYFHSSQYLNDLANGEICMALGWSGDVAQAQVNAEEADNGHEIVYTIPEEGTVIWFDTLAIPVDAQNVDEAHAFINFVMAPKNMAGITNLVWFGNPVPASLPLVDEAIKSDPSIFPPPAVQEQLFTIRSLPQRVDRIRNRVWTRVKSGV